MTQLSRRIDLLLALPLESLERRALEERLRRIGLTSSDRIADHADQSPTWRWRRSFGKWAAAFERIKMCVEPSKLLLESAERASLSGVPSSFVAAMTGFVDQSHLTTQRCLTASRDGA